MISLDPNFRDLLNCLNSAGVRYMVVGGYAVNFHGHHRNTKDIDIWLAVAPDNAARVSQALQEFGFAAKHVRPEAEIPSNMLDLALATAMHDGTIRREDIPAQVLEAIDETLQQIQAIGRS